MRIRSLFYAFLAFQIIIALEGPTDAILYELLPFSQFAVLSIALGALYEEAIKYWFYKRLDPKEGFIMAWLVTIGEAILWGPFGFFSRIIFPFHVLLFLIMFGLGFDKLSLAFCLSFHVCHNILAQAINLHLFWGFPLFPFYELNDAILFLWGAYYGWRKREEILAWFR